MTLCLPGGGCYPTYSAPYPSYTQEAYNPYYYEPSLFSVQYKIPAGVGGLQRYEITVRAFNEYDAFQQAIRYMPPYSQITKIRRMAMHPHP
ncbi:hypothetical protein E2P64_05890 [Candidatus Bathyarchaeota archaeon]|nr:hypothetical protein E2P64_05890 [Candidatus Bathyarchaeota archaeon]